MLIAKHDEVVCEDTYTLRSNPEIPCTRLDEGAFDFVIADEPAEPLSVKYIVERVLTDYSIVVCGPKHALGGLAPTELASDALLKHPWIGLGPFMPTMKGFQSLFSRAEGDGPSRLLETSSIDLTIAELRSNRYLAVLPRELVQSELKAGTLLELPIALEPMKGWGISVIRLAEHTPSPAVADFLDCVRSVSDSG